MKTDKLIEILSEDLEAVSHGQVAKTIGWAAMVGAAAAVCLSWMILPIRDFGGAGDVAFFALKLAFGLTLVAGGITFLIRSAQPGRTVGKVSVFLALPFVVLVMSAVVVMSRSPSGEWPALLLGAHSALCLVCIPLFAVPPLALLVWALRSCAPTHLTRTGALAGLVAGALGAVAYALACPDDTLPFVAVWYSVPIALCAFVGSKLGPRVLRW